MIDKIQRRLNQLQQNGERITNSEIKKETMTIESDIQELVHQNDSQNVKLCELKKMLHRVEKTLEPPDDTYALHVWKQRLDLPVVHTALPRYQITQQTLNGDKSSTKNQIII